MLLVAVIICGFGLALSLGLRFGSRGRLFQTRHRNALTEKAWEDAIQELGKS